MSSCIWTPVVSSCLWGEQGLLEEMWRSGWKRARAALDKERQYGNTPQWQGRVAGNSTSNLGVSFRDGWKLFLLQLMWLRKRQQHSFKSLSESSHRNREQLDGKTQYQQTTLTSKLHDKMPHKCQNIGRWWRWIPTAIDLHDSVFVQGKETKREQWASDSPENRGPQNS